MIKDSKYDCDVCLGMGTYPIINRHGQDLYSIPCPECHRPALAQLASADDSESRRQDANFPEPSEKDNNRP